MNSSGTLVRDKILSTWDNQLVAWILTSEVARYLQILSGLPENESKIQHWI